MLRRLYPTALTATIALAALAAPLAAQQVGPARGAVVVVGGGAIGPDVYERFIALAGGPDALIVDVPTAGGDSLYPADWRGTAGLKAAGARNVVVLHTVHRAVADDSAFAAVLARAGGVWFEGGRQWHLVDSYAGTRTERGFHAVLARGGVVGGTSAGASILSSYLLRGARSGNAIVMDSTYDRGFGFLRNVAIDQHVVARGRLADLADSLVPRRPDLLGISEDEGTAWIVQGDSAVIVGRNKAFAYGGRGNDAGRPFVTLYPGDSYDLAARAVRRRAGASSRLDSAFVDGVFREVAASGSKATVLVARQGNVLVDRAFNVPIGARYMPPTTVPNFAVGGLSEPVDALLARLTGRTRPLAHDSAYRAALAARIFTPIGAHQMAVVDGQLAANVDELYRFALGLEHLPTFFAGARSAGAPQPGDDALGWQRDTYRGTTRLSAYGTPDGRRAAFVRLPERRVTVIVLTDRDDVDARRLADRLLDRLAP